MSDYVNGLTNAIRNAYCNVLGNINNFNAHYSRLPFGWTNAAGPIAGHLYRSMCNREPPPMPPPPFYGGQCCGRLYKVAAALYVVDQDGYVYADVTNESTVNGRIITADLQFGQGTWASRLVYSPSPNCDGIAYGSFGAGTLFSSSRDMSNSTITIVNITPLDGPDDCGDPPPVIPEPEPGYDRPDFTFNYSPDFGPDIEINGNLTFSRPTINFDGNLNIPVRINLGGLNPSFNGQLNLNGPFLQFNFGNPNYAPSPSPGPDDYTPGNDSPEPPPDVPNPVLPPSPDNPEPDTTAIIRGCIVTVSNVSESAGVIFQDDNPDIYIPNLGYVAFLVAVGNTTAWTVDLPVKNKRCLIPCPWDGGAIAVRGTPREGVTWTVTEVVALPEESFRFDD